MTRIGIFVVALAAAFALAFGGGRLADVGERTVAEAADDHGADEAEHASAGPAGLAVAADGYRLVAAQGALQAGGSREYAFRIIGPDGKVVRDFDVEHERRLHLIVVRRELDSFLHVHPVQRADGTWSVRLRLPAAGVYRVFADFSVRGERRTLGRDLFGQGVGRRVVPDARGPYEATLQRQGERLEFRVTRDGEPVRVQPYLGAQGHLVVLREGDLAYVHAHADDDRLAFDVPFPTPGRYRLFLQFKVGGSVQTVALGVTA